MAELRITRLWRLTGVIHPWSHSVQKPQTVTRIVVADDFRDVVARAEELLCAGWGEIPRARAVHIISVAREPSIRDDGQVMVLE